jgi:hypothetical protein
MRCLVSSNSSTPGPNTSSRPSKSKIRPKTTYPASQTMKCSSARRWPIRCVNLKSMSTRSGAVSQRPLERAWTGESSMSKRLAPRFSPDLIERPLSLHPLESRHHPPLDANPNNARGAGFARVDVPRTSPIRQVRRIAVGWGDRRYSVLGNRDSQRARDLNGWLDLLASLGRRLSTFCPRFAYGLAGCFRRIVALFGVP